jgi:glycosyltransferase involved in cell wall biosynthesis
MQENSPMAAVSTAVNVASARVEPVRAPSAKPLVLHISADYPDPHRGPTTTAVERLVTGTRDADHIVVSLNRTNNPGKTHFRDCGMVDGVRLFAFRYFAPPLGIGLFPSMRAVAERIAEMLEREGLRPSVIHAHKFAFEGAAGLHLARQLGDDVALLVSVRGEAESKVLRYKPRYLPLLQKIADRAERIYYVSAWFRPILNAKLSIDPEKEVLLPNIVGNTRADIPARDPVPRFVCVLNLRIRRRKGLDHLLQAFRGFHARHPEIVLDLIGDGDAESIAAVETRIAKLGLNDSVRLLGKMDNAALTEALPDYLALLLPSFNETFGMVYVEALFAGIPILYGRNTGIDGYLDGIDAGVAVTPGDVGDIETGMERLFADNGAFRAAIGRNAATLHARFDAEAVLGRYRDDIYACVAKSR